MLFSRFLVDHAGLLVSFTPGATLAMGWGLKTLSRPPGGTYRHEVGPWRGGRQCPFGKARLGDVIIGWNASVGELQEWCFWYEHTFGLGLEQSCNTRHHTFFEPKFSIVSGFSHSRGTLQFSVFSLKVLDDDLCVFKFIRRCFSHVNSRIEHLARPPSPMAEACPGRACIDDTIPSRN